MKISKIICTVAAVFGGILSCAAADTFVETVAGTGAKGYSGDGGPAVDAKLNDPFGVIHGPDGALYFCDTMNHVIRRVDEKSGVITTVAGTGKKGYSGDGGPATKATMNEPYEIRFDRDGNMFIVERMNHVVRKVDVKSGVISTVAGSGKSGFGGDGGPAVEAKMEQPHSIQLSADERELYICDIKNHRIRVVDLKRGKIDTLAGTGKPAATKDGAKFRKNCPLKGPRALDRDAEGNLWLALREGNAVYKMDMRRGTIHHVAGTGKSGFTGNGGPAKEATLSGPKGVAIGPDGNVYLADTESHSVRMIDLSQHQPVLRLIAGTGKRGDGANEFARLHGIWVAKDGRIYVGDSQNHRVQRITLKP